MLGHVKLILFFLQVSLLLPVTNVLHKPMARAFSVFITLVDWYTAKCRLWPKQLSHCQPSFRTAATIFALLSVAIQFPLVQGPLLDFSSHLRWDSVWPGSCMASWLHLTTYLLSQRNDQRPSSPVFAVLHCQIHVRDCCLRKVLSVGKNCLSKACSTALNAALST